jgi:hypothetical protein
MLQAYIDDSGNDGRSPVFILAGYVSFAEKWKAFNEDWGKLLTPENGYPINALKMTDVFRNRKRNSRYFGWEDNERDERLKAFTTTIKHHALHGIVSVVPIESYSRLLKGRFTTLPLDRPYFLSFFGIMAQLFNLNRHLKLDEKIQFIFDTQDSENISILKAEYERFISVAPPVIQPMSAGYPTFERDEDALPLQAADMLAWHVRRYYYDLHTGKQPENEPSNVYLANLLVPEHDIIDVWDEARLSEVAEVLYKSSRLSLKYELRSDAAKFKKPTTYFLRRDPSALGGWRG